MYEEFMEFEDREIGQGHHEELHSLLERLESKYLVSEGSASARV
jgi:hypothetical protein